MLLTTEWAFVSLWKKKPSSHCQKLQWEFFLYFPSSLAVRKHVIENFHFIKKKCGPEGVKQSVRSYCWEQLVFIDPLHKNVLTAILQPAQKQSWVTFWRVAWADNVSNSSESNSLSRLPLTFSFLWHACQNIARQWHHKEGHIQAAKTSFCFEVWCLLLVQNYMFLCELKTWHVERPLLIWFKEKCRLTTSSWTAYTFYTPHNINDSC